MPKLTTPRDMFEEYEAEIFQVAIASVFCLIVTCGALEDQQKTLNMIFQLTAAFAFKCAASIPLCTWLNKDIKRDYLKLFLITLELSNLLIHLNTNFSNIHYMMIEAVFNFSLVVYSQAQIA